MDSPDRLIVLKYPLEYDPFIEIKESHQMDTPID
jgi:hypothetical protein